MGASVDEGLRFRKNEAISKGGSPGDHNDKVRFVICITLRGKNPLDDHSPVIQRANIRNGCVLKKRTQER